MKPKLVYKGRMKAYADCNKWLIWSNKWGCWYKPGSLGYTSELTQAGVFDYAEAMMHYTPTKLPIDMRVTEPFPVSCVKGIIRKQLKELKEKQEKLEEMLNEI